MRLNAPDAASVVLLCHADPISNLYSLRFVYAFANLLRQRQPAVNARLDAQSRQLYAAYWPDHFVENLTRILEIAKERYPHVYLMTLATLTSDDPSPDELQRAHFPVGMDKNMAKLHHVVRTYNRAVRQVAAATSVPIIDLYSLFDDPEARSSFTDSCHVDEGGAKRIADHVSAEILRRELSEPRLGSIGHRQAERAEAFRSPRSRPEQVAAFR